jgi:hypothetical protein
VARNSLAAAKAELYALLQTGGTPTVSGVTAVFDYEPFSGQSAKPVAMTIFTAGMTPTDYLIALRIYHTTEVDVAAAQAALDTIIQATDALMTSGFGPSEWTVEFQVDIAALVATNVFQVGREDAAFS